MEKTRNHGYKIHHNQKFLKLIFNHEELYNTTHKKFRDKEHCEKLWDEIGKRTGSPAERCSVKWHVIRSKFLKFYQTNTLITGEKFELHDEMMPFLPFIEKQPKPKNTNHINMFNTSKGNMQKIQRLENDPPCTEPYPSLINLVFEYRALYDKCHPLYSDESHTQNIWKLIAAQLNYTEKQCISWWNTARAKYLTFFKMATIHTGRKHCLHNLMVRFVPFYPKYFNAQVIAHNRRDRNDIQEQQNADDLLEENEELYSKVAATSIFAQDLEIKMEEIPTVYDVEPNNVTDLTQVKEEIFEDNPNIMNLYELNETFGESSNVLQTCKDSESDKSAKAVEDQLIDTFFETVSASFKNFTALRQNQAKLKIYEVVSSLELEQLRD